MRIRPTARAVPRSIPLLVLLLLALAAFLAPWTARSHAGAPEGLSYTFEGKPFPLTVSSDTVAVRLAPGASAESVLGRDAKAKALGNQGWHLVPATGGALDQVQQLATESGVRLASPVIEAGGAQALLGDEILVHFRTDATPAQVQSVLNQFTRVPRESLAEGSHLLRVSTRSGVVALQEANRLAALPFVEWAEPNFLNLVDRPETGASRDRSSALAARVLQPVTATVSRRAPVAEPSNQRGAATWTTILDEDFSGDFPGVGWTVTGNPTWGRVSDGQGNFALWPAAGGSAAVPAGQTPTNLDARMIFGPFDLSDATYAKMLFRFNQTYSKWTDEALVVYTSTDGANFTLADYFLEWDGGAGLPFSFNQDPGGTGGGDILLGDLRGQPQVWIMVRYLTMDPAGSQGPFLHRLAIQKSTRAGTAISADPLSSLQWHLNNTGQTGGAPNADLRALNAWARNPQVDPTLVVAVLDCGVDLAHEDLNLVPGFDATGGGSQGAPGPDQAHGTACAGLIGAIGNNGLGVIGVAPNVRIMPIRLTDDAGFYADSAAIASGIRHAFQNGARILNNSWGGGTPSSEIHEAILDANSAGAVVLFASGNTQGEEIIYPALFPECIAVGSSNQCDGPKRIDDESLDLYGHNTGPELSVVAPGTAMVTTDLMGAQGYSAGNYTNNFNGTSSACPVAAGVVALMLSEDPTLTPAEVRDFLQRTADDVENVQLVGTPVDDLVGFGRVNADAALLAVETKKALGAGAAGTNPGLGDSGGGGCFIATAAYGSALHPKVAVLRQFRDEHLLTNGPGRFLTALYYRTSPPVARFISERPALKAAVRAGLSPVVAAVEHPLPALALALALALVGFSLRRRRRR